MKTIEKILQQYYSRQSNLKQRLGEFFINNYVSEPWPYLWYCESTVECAKVIEQWCLDNGYVRKMPKKINKE